MNAPRWHVYNRTAVGTTDDPYVDLVIAILRQAVSDAVVPQPKPKRGTYLQTHAAAQHQSAWKFLRNEGDDFATLCAWIGCDHTILQRRITQLTGLSLKDTMP